MAGQAQMDLRHFIQIPESDAARGVLFKNIGRLSLKDDRR
jgi:hypothetical protein